LVFEPGPEVLEFEKNVTKPKPQSFKMGRIWAQICIRETSNFFFQRIETKTTLVSMLPVVMLKM